MMGILVGSPELTVLRPKGAGEELEEPRPQITIGAESEVGAKPEKLSNSRFPRLCDVCFPQLPTLNCILSSFGLMSRVPSSRSASTSSIATGCDDIWRRAPSFRPATAGLSTRQNGLIFAVYESRGSVIRESARVSASLTTSL